MSASIDLHILLDQARAERQATQVRLEQAEASLAERRDQLSSRLGWLDAAQELAGTGSFRWWPETDAVLWSRNLFRLLGFEPDMAPDVAAFFQRVHPDDLGRLHDELGQATAARRPYRVDFRLVLPDGRVRFVRAVGKPGGTDFYTGAVIDLTEQREAEGDLLARETELARVSRLTTMGELAASIAHEVNQPLTAIAANAGATVRWLSRPEPDLERAIAGLELIVGDGRRAGGVIRGLHALASEAGTAPAEVRLDELVREVVSVTRAEADAHKVAVRVDLRARDAGVLGEKVQLQQVILNLVLNGIEAMHEVDRPRVLTIATRTDGDSVRLSVADAGDGLPAGEPDRLFEPFYTTKPNGMGMGLSICRSIVKGHGGVLSASAGTPIGAIFSVTLPLHGKT